LLHGFSPARNFSDYTESHRAQLANAADWLRRIADGLAVGLSNDGGFKRPPNVSIKEEE
jgi:hypothetical protein